MPNPWTQTRYPEFDPEDIRYINMLHGNELISAGDGKDIGAVAGELERRKGIPTGDVSVAIGGVPEYVYPEAKDKYSNPWVGGIQLSRGKHYPYPIAAENIVAIKDKPTPQLLSAIDHELEHVKESRSLPSGVYWNPDAQSNSNAAKHFMSDEPGQMFNYEARDTLQRLIERLGKVNK